MAREIDPLDRPALAARGVHIEDGERHRQSLAPIDHPHQIGILQIVIIDPVAAIGELAGHDLGEQPAAGIEPGLVRLGDGPGRAAACFMASAMAARCAR